MVDRNSLFGPIDPATDAGYQQPPARMGFFTDTSVCIGCKACEVACKEWNLIPEGGLNLTGMSYDNTGALGASTWRHVAFIEQAVRPGRASPAFAGTPTGPSGSTESARVAEATYIGMPTSRPEAEDLTPGSAQDRVEMRWLMSSDVCKHCTHAACLDVCPTGSLFRTEFGTVVVQQDICNGCGYCIPACPYGVIEQRKDDGRAFKCTLCYERTRGGLEPACATACPTDSIQYGPVEELRRRAIARRKTLQDNGITNVQLYGHDPDDGVGGAGAFFLLLDEPEVYGLPPDPVVTTRDLPAMWKRAGLAGLAMAAAAVMAFAGGSS